MTSNTCSICLDTFEQKVITSCGHEYCSECLGKCLWLYGNRCPEVNCRCSIDVCQIYQKFTKGDTKPISSLDFYFINNNQELNIIHRTETEFHSIIPSSMTNSIIS